MKKPYGPSQGARMLRDLRIAAQRLQREEFNKIVCPVPVQMQFPFSEETSNG